MENASKALIMAAEVLIGVMIISVGVYLFHTFANYSKENYQKMEDTQIAEFNQQFIKFYGKNENKSIECTIHDIVGIANLAKQYNYQNNVENESGASDATSYIQVKLKVNNTIYGSYTNNHLEKCTVEELTNLIKKYDLAVDINGNKTEVLYFNCVSYTINNTTKRVNSIQFTL